MKTWVEPMAQLYDAGHYLGTPNFVRSLLAFSPRLQRSVDMAFNRFCIEAQKAAGKQIIDAGTRDVSAKLPSSPFYNMERRATRNYSGSVRYK